MALPGAAWSCTLSSYVGRLRERSLTLGTSVLVDPLNDVVWPSQSTDGGLCLVYQTSESGVPKKVHVAVVYIEDNAILRGEVDLVSGHRLLIDYIIMDIMHNRDTTTY